MLTKTVEVLLLATKSLFPWIFVVLNNSRNNVKLTQRKLFLSPWQVQLNAESESCTIKKVERTFRRLVCSSMLLKVTCVSQLAYWQKCRQGIPESQIYHNFVGCDET